MQVILLKDVPKLGRQFDVKNVADGYALNLLFPRGLAERATSEKVAALESKRTAMAHLMEADQTALHEALQRLDGTAVTVQAGKASEKGSLYKGIDAEMIAAALSKVAGVKITPAIFELAEPIKATGAHPLTLAANGSSATVTIMVEAGK